ncbi:hypothetical protein [Streptomyces sp. DH24]|uniref:hypothetical protein n=1 Tax=Streptomyces sp. DH24 TaxID=3040123 RepID=UPI0024432DDC|nr:hypothetical protein [Streptomyces sp. DH24]MDG9720884.1 hypothetical protein [Streptomyces sp. DH24]
MGTAERLETSVDDGAGRVTAPRGAEAPDLDIPAAGQGRTSKGASEGTGTAAAGTPQGDGTPEDIATEETRREQAAYRPLWIEEPARRRRLPDPVRTAAVRAVLIIAVTLVQAVVAFLCTMAGSWLAFPMVISSVASTVVATWGALDVWVTRQVWNQRNGVVSTPSSTARALRRERRRARRQARAAERTQERIRRQGGASQLSHS